MAGKFTVHAFGVLHKDGSQALQDVLKLVEQDPIEDRNRYVGTSSIRIEHIAYDAKDNVWYMDFVKMRDTHGPAKGSKTKAVEGFLFKDDETFCEETAVIYSPKTNHIIVQYNHYGVKYAAIENYFSYYNDALNNVYELTPKYDADVERHFEKRSAIRKLEMGIDPRHLTKADKVQGTAVYDAIDVGDKSDAAHVSIEITATRGKKGKLNQYIDKSVEFLRKLQATNPNAVSKINATVVSIDNKVQVLDLIAQRLSRTLSDLPLGDDKRWPRDDRYRGLRRVMLGWKAILK